MASAVGGGSVVGLYGAAGDALGASTNVIGDVNGDGFADILVGAEKASPQGQALAGSAYVVFGKAGGIASGVDIAGLADGNQGFVLNGATADDRLGIATSIGGDVNGDGYTDIVVGASQADGASSSYNGAVFVMFGQVSNWSASYDVESVADGNAGFRVTGAGTGDNLAVTGVGDVNGDGFAMS